MKLLLKWWYFISWNDANMPWICLIKILRGYTSNFTNTWTPKHSIQLTILLPPLMSASLRSCKGRPWRCSEHPAHTSRWWWVTVSWLESCAWTATANVSVNTCTMSWQWQRPPCTETAIRGHCKTRCAKQNSAIAALEAFMYTGVKNPKWRSSAAPTESLMTSCCSLQEFPVLPLCLTHSVYSKAT